MFQSAPAIAGGRCCSSAMHRRALARFNPRPPLLAGDATTGHRPLTTQTVSIRARHCWRAMLERLGALGHGAAVSIRARHCWRAMRTYWQQPTGATPSFNPRPPLLAGDARVLRASPQVQHVSIRARHCWRAMHYQGAADQLPRWFQSAPAIAGGRCRIRTIKPEFFTSVSIRARHCWRAMHAGVPQLGEKALVSIRARHCWRAMPAAAG